MNEEITTGVMLSEIAFANMPILLKNGGLDFFIIDCEHGAFDYNDISKIIMNSKLINLPIIIRLPDNHRKDITKVMDMGAGGLLLPMTNNSKDIEQVVKFAKYSPIGQRGISTTRAHTLYNPEALPVYMKKANMETRIYAQIETKSGLDNLNSILTTKGIDGVFLGPNDLSCDLNCIGDDAPVLSAIEYVAAQSIGANKQCGIITSNTAYIKKAKEAGMRLFCCGSELNMIMQSCKDIKNIIEEC